ncbi:hypothetical protein SMSP2_00963 [Limihaloglobus sulfuriphilus]|uniref:DUF3352 domain-containing protein n=1 Tax=Limihaloglobus sulfuriphilus TaxID=1851148 RepID=A0A1Q2MD79_9BACT|nr:hypothetical protein [Limihaloglobus sulfuriphilus]AQQ70609.1 hypothetical protein SMSP2_00963 [Limihaloglobus sulfuriphilus]
MKPALFIVCSLLTCVLCISAPLEKNHVPADSRWVVHADLERLRGSEIWSLAINEFSEKHQKKIDAITKAIGSDPTTDFTGITVYGLDEEQENAVALIYARYNKEKLISILEENEKYNQGAYRDYTLYHWLDDKTDHIKTGIFALDDLIVISDSQKQVEDFIDLLHNEKDSLETISAAPLAILASKTENPILLVAAVELSTISRGKTNRAIAQNSKQMLMTLNETDQNVYLDIALEANSLPAAEQIKEVVSGIKSFINLRHSQNPDVISLLEKTQVQLVGELVTIRFDYPSADIFDMMMNNCKFMNK